MTDIGDTLAIDGGTPVRAAAWPDAPLRAPASDGRPLEAVEAAIATILNVPATAVIAYATADEAVRAALGRPAEQPESTANRDAVDGVHDPIRDEIVLPSLNTSRAAAQGAPELVQAARAGGWRVVPGEVEPDTAALALRGLTRALGPQTGMAVVSHAFGHPAAMTELMRVAREHGVTLVEDITGALGATYRHEPVGRLGHRGVMTTSAGDPVTRGAYVIAPDPADAASLRAARSGALADDDARIALAEVRALPDEIEQRRQLAWELTFGLHGMRGVAPMAHGRWVQHAYASYVVRLRTAVWRRPIAEAVAALHAEGIPAAEATGTLLHRDPAILQALPDDPRLHDDVFVAASRLPSELIAVPLHSGLTSRDMADVAAALRKLEAHSS